MGTKKHSWALFDTLSAHISSDRSHKTGRKSRDPSPRPGAAAPAERERTREEEWREREMERLRQDKARGKRKDMDPREKYPEKEGAVTPRARPGERDRRDREGRPEDEARPNGRPVSHFETRVLDKEAERARNKGDTFPRMRKHDDQRDRRRDQFDEKDRGDRRPMERQPRTVTDDLEREREKLLRRERQGDRERYQERDRDNRIEDTTVRGKRDRPRETDRDSRERRRERDPEVNDPCNRKEKDTFRERDRLKPNIGERQGPRGSSPRRRPDRDLYLDHKGQERAERMAGKRVTRSEGDSDEDRRKKTQRERIEDSEQKFRHSRSEGDEKGRGSRERDRDGQRYREDDRRRDMGRHGRQEAGRDRDRRKEREGERRRDGEGATSNDRQRERERYREVEEDRRRCNKKGEREADPRRDEAVGRGRRDRPQGQSSGEWSSDVESDRQRHMAGVEGREYREESMADSKSTGAGRGAGGGTDRGLQRDERPDRERGEEQVRPRKMWLEPRRGKYSQGSSLEDEVGEERTEPGTRSGKERQREKEELDERYFDRGATRVTHLEQRGRGREEEEGVSVDREDVREAWAGEDRGQAEGRRLGGEGESFDSSEGSGSEGWTDGERDKMLSGEDGFVTADSGGDEEDERLYSDSRECWEAEACRHSGYKGHGVEREGWEEEREDRVQEEGEGREGNRQVPEKKPTFVFCVIGQTLPRSDGPSKSPDLSADTRQSHSGSSVCGDNITQQRHSDSPPIPGRIDQCPAVNLSEDRDSQAERERDNETRAYTDDTSRAVRYTTGDSEAGEGAKVKAEHPYAEIGPVRKNSETEKLLAAWREKEALLAEQNEKEKERMPSPIDPYGEVGYRGESAPTSAPSDENGHIIVRPEEEDEVAIRIRMSGPWSLAEEAKRHSQAPHLKWAKNVVSEILGHSEEHAIADDPRPPGPQEGQEDSQPDEMPEEEQQQEQQELEEVQQEEKEEEGMVGEGAGEVPIYAMVQKQKAGNRNSGTDVSEGEGEVEPQEMEELRGTGQSQPDMHADQVTDMHGDTHTDTLLDTGREDVHCSTPTDTQNTEGTSSRQLLVEEAGAGEVQDRSQEDGGKAEESREESGAREQGAELGAEEEKSKEVEMFLSVSNTLYKPRSCPSLSYDTEVEQPGSGVADGGQEGVEERTGETEEEDEEVFDRGSGEELGMRSQGKEEEEGEGEATGESKEGGEVVAVKKAVLVKSSVSFRDLGPEARFRRRGIRKTTERRKRGSLQEADEDEGLAGDRRTRIFTTPDGEDCRSDSWGEVDLRNVLDTIGRRKRNSKFFNAAQLYQQYSEAAQNIEILRQARSDTVSVSVTPGSSASPPPSPTSSSPTSSSPAPARRPLPPLPPVAPHPHSLSHTGSITSVKSLPLPEPPASQGRRSSSPRLSIANNTQTLWQDLPGVRNSTELGDFTEDQRRLQEVRFEVVTSEASYCRSLDIVVDNFVKSKQLGALLTTQDRNWLFSRLSDVRAISHSFLSKLEERVESDTMHFSVCDIIARHCKRFRTVYVPYLTNQSYQDATYQRLMNENPRFKLVVEKLERSPVCQRLPLRSFLILPFQRITRIKLLVQNIVKRTAPGTEEVVQAIKALRMLEKLIQESNDSITQMKSIESLVSLSAKVDFECRTLPLVSQSRRMVREGPVTELMDFSLKETERTVYLHLFNDYLLLSLHKEGGRFTVIDHSPVSDLRAENCRVKLHSLQKNLFRLHLSNKALLLRTDTQSDKLRWISAVSRPHPEIDFSAAQDFTQMQCIRAFVAQQPDELSLEKADILLVHQQSSDGWVEGTRLSDRHRGWMPESHLETITNPRVQERNLSDALKLTTATAAV